MLSESVRFINEFQGVLELPKLYVCALSLKSPKDFGLKHEPLFYRLGYQESKRMG